MIFRSALLSGLCAVAITSSQLEAHCQMPCGIYHDQMIYDKLDEYFETMVKAVMTLNNNEFKTVQERNQFTRWVMTKERMSDEVADVLMTYFLQQKIKPGNDDDTTDLLRSVHKMLFLVVAIKQNVDVKIVREFGNEWDHFKDLFHPEMECRKVMHSEAAKLLNDVEPPEAPKLDATKGTDSTPAKK